jgi:hypothetical protein
MDMQSHLESRGLDVSQYALSWDADTVSFMLFNLTGQLVGYQNYRPDAEKRPSNDPRLSRYFTWCRNNIAVWGLETYHWRTDVLFIAEGVFDACKLHNLGLPAVAVLSNNPVQLKNWLACVPRRIIAVCDDDAPGRALGKLANLAITCEQGQDLGDMTQTQVIDFIKKNIPGILD